MEEDYALNASTNTCEPYRDRYPDILDLPALQVILGALYSCVWLAGVTGNTVVIYVALAKRFSFSIRTVFILSLACSDLVVAMTSLPVTSITLLSHNWLFPNFLCKCISFLQACGIFQSSFTLTAIAIDRYCLIFYPHKLIMTYKRAKLSTLLMCCNGMLFASPMAIFTKIITWNSVCGVFCTEDWGDAPELGRLYGSAVLVLQFGLPLCVCSYCYLRISFHLHGRMVRRLRHEAILPEAVKRLDERRSKTNRMMVVMVLSFLLTWCPFNLLNIIRDFEIAQPLIQLSIYNTLYAFTHLTAMTSLIWNPITYSWFNESFREAIRGVCYDSKIEIELQNGTVGRLLRKNRKFETKCETLLTNEKNGECPIGHRANVGMEKGSSGEKVDEGSSNVCL